MPAEETMKKIRAALSRHYPSLEQLPFCAALREGLFDKHAVLRAEVVELYRALRVRDRIKQAFDAKIALAVGSNTLSTSGAATIRGVVEDEGETEEHIDHLDMRLKLFQSVGVTRRAALRPNARLDEINEDYVAIVEASDVFQVIGIHAAIEDWYAPVSAFFEKQYLLRGFSADEVETYTVHKAADVWHSSAGFEVLADHRDRFDIEVVADAVGRMFATSLAYDAMKLELARAGDIRDLVEGPR